MNHCILLILSIGAIVSGLCFDIFLIRTYSNLEKLDNIVFHFTIILMIDVIFKETGRAALSPLLISKKIEIDRLCVSVKKYLYVHIVYILLISVVFYAFCPVETINIVLYLFLYIYSSYVMSVYQSILIVKNKLWIYNLKGMAMYTVALVVLVVLGVDSISNLYIAFLVGNVVYLLGIVLIKYPRGLESYTVPFILRLSCGGIINMLVGQCFRFLERCLLLSFQPGVLSSYYFSFRVFASIQQTVGINISNIYLKRVVRDKLLIIRKIGKAYLLFSIGIVITIYIAICNKESLLLLPVPEHVILLLNTSLPFLFILSFGLFPQMMMPVVLPLVFLEEKSAVWLRRYVIATILILVLMYLATIVSNYNILVVVSVIGIYVNFVIAVLTIREKY